MKVEVNGSRKADADLVKYLNRKMNALDKYIPRHARKSTHAEVHLEETKIKEKKQSQCEVILHLPGENIVAKESTMNMHASIDIVEEKLKQQLRTYKTKQEKSRKVSPARLRKVLLKIRSR